MFVYVQVCALTNGVYSFRLLYEGFYFFFGWVDASKIRILVRTTTVLVYMCEIILYLIAMNTTINNILMIQSAFKSMISSLLRIHAHARTHTLSLRENLPNGSRR